MLHFPSSLKNGASNSPRRADSLNATQQKSATHQIFSVIEEELHDARRVHADGQEDDLRFALNMVINRVRELSSLLGEAYKSQADLEVQLNVAKSNLQLVISNNEMLEEALKRDSSGHSKDVGWRRWSAREGETRDQRVSEDRLRPPADSGISSESASGSGDVAAAPGPSENGAKPIHISPQRTSSAPNTQPSSPATTQDNRFFRFRFTSSTNNSRPSTSSGTSPVLPSNGVLHLTSPSMPSLPAKSNKELEELNAELEKERAARKAIADEKAALEAELESLSQALFEEANKMVSTERMKRAETEEELKQVLSEKDAMRSALMLIEGENEHLRTASTSVSAAASPNIPSSHFDPLAASSLSHSRTSSRVGVKSRSASPFASPNLTEISSPPSSPVPSLHPLPLSPPSSDGEDNTDKASLSDDEYRTPQYPRSRPLSFHEQEHLSSSPWADAPSTLTSAQPNFSAYAP